MISDPRQPGRPAPTPAAAEAELGLEWLLQVAALPVTGVEHREVVAAVAAVREEPAEDA